MQIITKCEGWLLFVKKQADEQMLWNAEAGLGTQRSYELPGVGWAGVASDICTLSLEQIWNKRCGINLQGKHPLSAGPAPNKSPSLQRHTTLWRTYFTPPWPTLKIGTISTFKGSNLISLWQQQNDPGLSTILPFQKCL